MAAQAPGPAGRPRRRRGSRRAAREQSIELGQAQRPFGCGQGARRRRPLRISAWAAIGLALTAIAGIYGMNFDNMPELRWEYGCFAVLTVIAVVCLTLYVLFRRNGWL